jgi:hypothetical protein
MATPKGCDGNARRSPITVLLAVEITETVDARGIYENDPDRRRVNYPPVYLAALLLAKTVKGMLALLSPVVAQIPAAVEFRQVLAIALLVAAFFIVGLIVRTGPGLRAKNAFERSVLEKLPGYTFLRGLAGRLTGR